jgi:hypothetical protein
MSITFSNAITEFSLFPISVIVKGNGRSLLKELDSFSLGCRQTFLENEIATSPSAGKQFEESEFNHFDRSS